MTEEAAKAVLAALGLSASTCPNAHPALRFEAEGQWWCAGVRAASIANLAAVCLDKADAHMSDLADVAAEADNKRREAIAAHGAMHAIYIAALKAKGGVA